MEHRNGGEFYHNFNLSAEETLVLVQVNHASPPLCISLQRVNILSQGKTRHKKA